MMMKRVFIIIFAVVCPASSFADHSDNSDDYVKTVLADIGFIDNGLWVAPDTVRKGDARHFRFTIIPNEYTGSAMLEILFDAPEGQTPEPLVYQFDHAGIEYPIADFVYQNGNQYFVYLPELKAHRKVEFSLGLKYTSFSNYHVTALLTVDNGQTSAEWIGWKRADLDPWK